MDKGFRLLLLAFSATLLVGFILSTKEEQKAVKTHEKRQISNILHICTCKQKRKIIKQTKTNNWNAFINALIHIESKGKWDAVGTSNDVGVLQITPICVEQANIYVGYDKYSLDDRLDSLKSVEMFNIIQDKLNPEHDLHFALKIWNSKAPISYHEKVISEYKKRKNNEKVL